jgi:3'-phosphoadenosine 5'-phosphosulfate sulfotransferase (PAPS reductase)/FAD synthetase
MMTQYADILSFGAGVNSVALAIHAINDGWAGEIVFADTGCEWPETMCYLSYFEREWLAPRGRSVTVLGGMPWQKYKGGVPLIDYCEAMAVIPLCSVRWCTAEWKVEPLKRYAAGRSTMIGIASDERHRQPDAIRPLVERGIDREGCIRIIEAAGLDVPQKSGCYICPFMRVSQWRELWQRHPELFERAARLEENAQSNERSKRTNVTLDPSGRYTLRDLQLRFESQMTLPDLDLDDYRRYQPCVCTL